MLKLDVKKFIGITLLVLLVISSIPTRVYAAALGSSPSSIEITDALRGNNYQRIVRFFSNAEQPATIKLTANGAMADWVTYYSFNEPNKIITAALIPAKSDVTVIAKIAIPDDAANGVYLGALIAETTAPDSTITGAGVQVNLQTTIAMSIMVTGTENLAGEVTRVEIDNTEIGLPLNIDITFKNTGNVVATPTINVKILQEGNTVDEFSYADTTVNVDSSDVITLQWDTSGNKSGAYNAEVSVELGGTQIYQEKIAFRILPRGGLSGEGEITGLTTEGTLGVGTVTKILATFKNTGVVETLVHGYAEIYLDGALVTVLDSEEITVNGGEQGTLTFYFNPDKAGDYDIKVHATMAGIQTNTMELTLTVSGTPVIIPPSAEPEPTGVPAQIPEEVVNTATGMAAYWYVIIGLAGAAVIAGAYLFARRRTQFVPVLVANYNKAFNELAHNKLFKKIKLDRINFRKPLELVHIKFSKKRKPYKINFNKPLLNGRK
jgi:hypothetical protein